MSDLYKIEVLARSSADIYSALKLVREASTGYVAVHASPERNEATKILFEYLSDATTTLVAAEGEVTRLLNKAMADE